MQWKRGWTGSRRVEGIDDVVEATGTVGKAMKRQFKQRDEQLIDRYDHDDGYGCDVRFVPELQGQSLSPVDVEPGGESPEDLLEAFDEGKQVQQQLVAHVDDPQVLRTLRQALEPADGPEVMNTAQALGNARDRKAVGSLERLLVEFTREIDADSDVAEWKPLAAVSVARALLLIDPWHQAAAETLEKMSNSPRRDVRNHSAMATAAVLEKCGKAAPVQQLRTTTENLLDDPDPQVFFHAAEPLITGQWSRIRERTESLLSHRDWQVRRRAVGFLAKVPPPRAAEAIRMLLDRLAAEENPRIILGIVSYVGPLIERKRRERLVASLLDDQSPAVRFDTLYQVFPKLEADVASRLAATAAKDEPDPVLVKWLERYVQESR